MLLLVCTQPRTAVPFPDERSSAVKMMMMNECGLCARVDSSFSGINIIKKAYFFSGVLLDQVVIINHNVFYVLVNVIFFRPVLPRAEQATAGPQGDRKGMALI